MTDARNLFPVTLDLFAPPGSLSKNGREHWATRARDFAQYKDYAAWTLIERFGRDLTPYAGPVVMDVLWRAQKRWLPDSDNALERVACYRDALAVAGLIVDDAQVQIGDVRCEAARIRVARCVVTFRLPHEGIEA